MSEEFDLKKIWAQQQAQSPDVNGLKRAIQKTKRKKFWSMIVLNATIIFTIVAMIGITLYVDPLLLTTKLGVGIMILAMLIFLASYNGLIGKYGQLNEGLSNVEFLRVLGETRRKQHFIQTKMLSFYFVTLITGLGLALYQFLALMPRNIALTVAGLSLAWIAVNWFVFRPRIIKKQMAELDEWIAGVEAMRGGLEES